MRLLIGAAASLAMLTTAQAGTIPGTTCNTFPDDSWWHADVSKLPKHARSAAWMSNMGASRNLHPDFGPSFGAQSVPYGIPITVVEGSHARVTVTFDYDNESDKGPYPLGNDTKVEGGQFNSGDRHTVTVDKATCKLYETWATAKKNGKWSAGSGAIWSLTSYKLRPSGWTSADAAGFPILPLLLTYDEVAANTIDHAIRFTVDTSDRRFAWPARHQAGSVNDTDYPPMGARFRLKASYKIKSSLRTDTKRVLRAMKKYGLALADNGSNWYFQGTADTRWKNAMLDELKRVPASAFEAVDTASLRVSSGSMKVRGQ